MEHIRQAALVNYHSSLLPERDEIFAWFTSIDVDDDGRISKQELLDFMSLRTEKPAKMVSWSFAQFDNDRSGSIDFDEFVTLNYAVSWRPICDACREFITTGLYYSCVKCWEMNESDDGSNNHTFVVCPDCYSKKSFKHMHTEFLDNSMLLRLKNILAQGRKKKEKEARLTAGRIYYRSLTSSEKSIAENYFNMMDLDGDGRVSGTEVIGFMAANEIPRSEASKMLEEVGMAGDTFYLSIEEVVALWYLFVFCPCCYRCKTTITGMYYSCVACYNRWMNGANDADTCDLCPDCHTSGEPFVHEHDRFMDNFTLFRMKNNLQAMQGTATSSIGGGGQGPLLIPSSSSSSSSSRQQLMQDSIYSYGNRSGVGQAGNRSGVGQAIQIYSPITVIHVNNNHMAPSSSGGRSFASKVLYSLVKVSIGGAISGAMGAAVSPSCSIM